MVPEFTTVNEAAAVPPKRTWVAPEKLLPVMLMLVPAIPEVGVKEETTGISGFTVTAKLAETPLPQLLMPFTETSPETALTEKFTVMLLVLLPEAMLAPAGSIQLYPVALAMAGTL